MAGQTEIEKLVGPNLLLQKTTKTTAAALKGKEIVALYFSASWCPPCKQFTPVLVDFFHECANEGKLQIIYVSSDRDVPSFDENYGKMPWLAIPNNTPTVKNALAQKMNISGIPSLVLVDATTGHFITDDAKMEVMEAMTGGGSDKEKGNALIASWKEKEAVPLDQAVFTSGSGGGPQNPLLKVLMFFFKNPMYLLGAWYFIKKFLKKMELIGEDEDGNQNPNDL